jgi:D-3-phosphoglycerate dehydrogenase / 2-oxoglutarate reductase
MKHKYKVVFADYDYPSIDIELKQLEKVNPEIIEGQCKTEEDLIRLTKDADGIICQYAPFTAIVIDSLEKCQVIARYGVGVDNIDVKAATKKGIKIAYVPDYCIDEVSNHAIAMIMNFTRQISFLDRITRKKEWDVMASKPIFRLSEQTIGILGLGRIGSAVARKLRNFNVTLLACDPYVKNKTEGVKMVNFQELVEKSDYITIHTPLNNETKHIFTREVFKKMKRTSFLINTARGGMIDQGALYDALKDKKIRGAALDVLENEPPDWSKTPQLENLILTPHAAFYSESSFIELKKTTATSVVNVLQGKDISNNLYNPEVLKR